MNTPPVWRTTSPFYGRSFTTHPILPSRSRRVVTKFSSIDVATMPGREHCFKKRVVGYARDIEKGARSDRAFFNATNQGYSTNSVIHASENDGLQHLLIINPADGSVLDMIPYIRDVMAEIERELGCSFKWVAVIHKEATVANPDNQHSHIVIRGVDEEGNRITIPDSMIDSGFCYIAQKVATQHLGEMTEAEVVRANVNRETYRKRSVVLNKMTGLGMSTAAKSTYARSYRLKSNERSEFRAA